MYVQEHATCALPAIPRARVCTQTRRARELSAVRGVVLKRCWIGGAAIGVESGARDEAALGLARRTPTATPILCAQLGAAEVPSGAAR